MAIEQKTLLIADDHPIFREGIERLLAPIKWLKVIASAESGDAALAQIKYLKPDIVVLDLAMPGMDGLSVLEKAKAEIPSLIAVIVTSYDDRAYLGRALELGANAYVLKDGASSNIVKCLETVREGGIYISPTLGSHLPELPAINKDIELLNCLTDIEKRVLYEVAKFKTSKEIGQALGLSFRTIQNHRSHISKKLEISGSHQLMSFAREHEGLLLED